MNVLLAARQIKKANISHICLKSSRLGSQGCIFYECGHGNFHSRVSFLIVLFFSSRRREKGQNEGVRQSEAGEERVGETVVSC